MQPKTTEKKTHQAKPLWLKRAVLPLAMLLAGCANMGSGPQGGPKDENAPKYVSSTPTPDQKGYKSQKITLYFDEYVTLKDPYSKVVVSPPQNAPLSINALGKKVTVELGDSLEPERTYIVDFANSIADNNEGNELKDYFISFSTGQTIDTFEISGKIINALTLAPAAGVYVGAYESDADTAFTNTKMDYVAKTGQDGTFRIRGLKNREYSVFGLKDNNSNFKFDDKSEGIAVLGHRVRTSVEEVVRHDTTYKDSTTIDTIIARKTLRYMPDTLLMRLFVETKHLQYFKSASWTDKSNFTLNFVNEKKQLPTISALNFESKDWYRLEPGTSHDTLTYWLSDTAVANMDTLRFAIEYEKTDSAGLFIAHKDTIQLLAKKWKKDKKHKGPDFAIAKKVDYFKNPTVEWDSPIANFDESKAMLRMKRDSSWDTIACRLEPVENSPRKYTLKAAFEEGGRYTLTVDSGQVNDLMGHWNKEKRECSFAIRKKEEYTRLDLKVRNAQGTAYVELLDAKEKVVRKERLADGTASLANIEPGDYFLRLFEDSNNDGEWTTGDYRQKRAPEQVYYYPKKLTLKANWEREEEWDVKEKELAKQRPAELTTASKKKK